MKISVIGTGYVGLVQGVCFADTGNNVICMDIDKKKIRNLKRGSIPIYEPGLEELVKRNIKDGRLKFTAKLKEAVEKSKIIFLCLPTPQTEDGSADTTHVMEVSKKIAGFLNESKIIVSKSTVPVGTVEKIQGYFRQNGKHDVCVISNPEFLKEGTALQDSLKPDRIIIGTGDKNAAAVLAELYEPFVRTGNPVIVMDEKSAEMTKYAANSFLATKITFMNDLANLCEKVGADIESIRRGIGSDPRIGKSFLFAGIGYGGSCFPKDVKALVKTSAVHGHKLRILESVDRINEDQKKMIILKIKNHFKGELKGKAIAVWGVAFKPQTDDIREAPSAVIISSLLKEGAKVRVHDPAAMTNAKKVYGSKIKYSKSAYSALKGADALVVVTEWNEFRRLDLNSIKSLMKTPVIFDGRNIYDPDEVREAGFVYHGVGRKMQK
ncbi:MAG: UDP-glucose/GDP-mannose dehydrogenase family protein [Bacteroidetes bacterium]|nr:UDP-glucose/GDP-mannose dehydrogenase family protein [Bacteroidota bacterium]